MALGTVAVPARALLLSGDMPHAASEPVRAAAHPWALDAPAGLVLRCVTAARPDYRAIIALYEQAFPEHERMAPWVLRLVARRDGCDFFAFYDEGDLCAISFTVTTSRLTYLLYLAVEESHRCQGYGTRILEWFKGRRPHRPIALGIEPVYPGAPNHGQRERRRSFYERNGFYETGYTYNENGEAYSIMYDGTLFDPRAMEEALDELTFGLRRSEVTLVNNEARIARHCA